MSRWCLLLLLLIPAVVFAHRFATSSLRIEELPSGDFSVRWKTPVQQVSNVPLEPQLPKHCVLLDESPFLLEGSGQLKQSTHRCEGGLVGRPIAVTGLAANQASALLTLILQESINHQAVLTEGRASFVVPEEADPLSVVGRYTVLGAEHIWGGPDHLLFVMGLLLLVSGGRRLVVTITAFTGGHSVTLALVTLGVLSYPVDAVEFLIALSIFVLAVELTRPSGQSRLWRWPWVLAGGFGLLHGMGFAGALTDTGLPQTNLPLALLFFNVGIELGQLAFIGILLLLGRFLGRWAISSHPALSQSPVLLLGVLSVMWCIERGATVLGY